MWQIPHHLKICTNAVCVKGSDGMAHREQSDLGLHYYAQACLLLLDSITA